MSRLLFIGLICSVLGVSHATQFTYSLSPSTPDLTRMNGNYYYKWGIVWELPAGQELVGATLTFDSIQLTGAGLENHIWTHLLDLNYSSSRVIARWDNDSPSDSFANKGLLLGRAVFSELNEPHLVTYDFTTDPNTLATLKVYLSDGSFGIGIDPDCHYKNEGVTLTLVTQTVPDAVSTVWLLAAGLSSLACLRRKALGL